MIEADIKDLLLKNEELLIETVETISTYDPIIDGIAMERFEVEFLEKYFEDQMMFLFVGLKMGKVNFNHEFACLDKNDYIITKSKEDYVKSLTENIDLIIKGLNKIIKERPNCELPDEIEEVLNNHSPAVDNYSDLELLIRKFPEVRTHEMCPECDTESRIYAYGMSVCKVCDHLIKPCSMCDPDKVNCLDCPYDRPLRSIIRN